MGPGVYLVDPYGPGPPHQHAPQHHPPPPRAPTPPATPRSPATAAPHPPPPPTRPPGPSAFPVFVASEFEIHGLLTSSALSPPTRACLCVLSLDFVTVPLPRLSFVFSSWGVRVSPSFPFLLLGLRVRVCVCVSVSVSAFESPALFSQQRLPGFVLPVPPSLPPAPLFRGPGGPGVPGMSLVPLSPPTPPRAPAARLRLRGMSPHHPGIAWGIASLSWQPPGERSPGSSPFLCGRGRVASRRVARRRRLRAELGRLGGRRCGVPGGRRQRPVLGTFEPVVGSHLAAACILSLVLRSFGEPFRRVVTQQPGPRQSSQSPATLAATVPVAPRPRDVLLSPEIGSLGF